MTAAIRPGDFEERDLRATVKIQDDEITRLRTEIDRLSIDLCIRDGRIIGGQLVIPEHRAHLCRRSYLIGYADALDNQASIARENQRPAAQGPITYPCGSLGEEVQP